MENMQNNPSQIRDENKFANALDKIDLLINKRYLSTLNDLTPLTYSSSEEDENNIGKNCAMYELTRFVYDNDEDIQSKLSAVYQSVSSLENVKLFMLIRSNKKEQKIYLGVAIPPNDEEPNKIKNAQNLLKANMNGNFPGSKLIEFEDIPARDGKEGISKENQVKQIIEGVFNKDKDEKYIATVTGIPALRTEKKEGNKQFTQGIEKFMDSIVGKELDILILAEPVNNSKLQEMKAGYEEIYSELSPFAKTIYNISESSTISFTDTISNGITQTTTESLAKTMTDSHTKGRSSGNSVGGNVGLNFRFVNPLFKALGGGLGVNIGGNYNHNWGKHEDDTKSEGTTVTNGTNASSSKQDSHAKGTSSGHNNGIQFEYDDKVIKGLLERIDIQLKRLKTSESYGMYESGVYILSNEYSEVLAAAASYNAVMRGENSANETSQINIWDGSDEDDGNKIKVINNYLKRFVHPLFRVENLNDITVSPTTLISGMELSLQMGMPRKSVSGIPVVKTAAFGRKVLYLDDSVMPSNTINIGKIVHMNNVEGTDVDLNIDSLTSHVFVTGSTGSGKSTAVYTLIDKLCPEEKIKPYSSSECTFNNNKSVRYDKRKKQNGNDNINILDKKNNKSADMTRHFMVIEPAKGEYKDMFGGREDVKVYGTNPDVISDMLKLNPFSFPEKIHVLEHIDRIIDIFNACWPMYAAMPAILKDSIERAYISVGWDLTKSKCKYENEYGRVFPSFKDVIYQINIILKESQYSSDSKGDYTGALVTRLKSMTNGINGIIFSTSSLEDKELFDKNVIVDLSRVASPETKSLIMGMLLIKLQEYRMSGASEPNTKLKHVTVLEEAHNILKRTSTEQSSESSNLIGKSVEMITNAIAEMRTYGEAFVIVDQSPSSVSEAAIKNTNTKLIMRLPDARDREMVGKAAGLNDEQIVEIAKFKTGVAAIYQNNWIEAVACQIDNSQCNKHQKIYKKDDGISWEKIEKSDDDLKKELVKVMLKAFSDSSEEITADLTNRVKKSGLDGVIKYYYFSYCQEKKSEYAENAIFRIFYDDNNWKRELSRIINVKRDTDMWFKEINESIKPDINDLTDDLKYQLMIILSKKYSEDISLDNQERENSREVNMRLYEIMDEKGLIL